MQCHLVHVVQYRRYSIVEDIGCLAATKLSGLNLLLVDAPLVILPMVSGLYYCRKLFKY